MHASSTEFERVIASHLEPIAKASGASILRTSETLMDTAVVAADGLRLVLENDRGALSLSVSGANGERFWLIDHISSLFPRSRELEGVQRLSLEEQFQLVRDHWTELRTMFGPGKLKDTTQQLMSHIGPNLEWKP